MRDRGLAGAKREFVVALMFVAVLLPPTRLRNGVPWQRVWGACDFARCSKQSARVRIVCWTAPLRQAKPRLGWAGLGGVAWIGSGNVARSARLAAGAMSGEWGGGRIQLRKMRWEA